MQSIYICIYFKSKSESWKYQNYYNFESKTEKVKHMTKKMQDTPILKNKRKEQKQK